MKIGYASQSGAFAQLWIAAQRGFFAAEGLMPEIIFSRSVTGVQALIAGELDFVATGCPEFFRPSAPASISKSSPTPRR